MSAEDRQHAIRRMCELQARVAREVSGYSRAADCFCGESGFHPLKDPDDYRNDFAAIEWIEQAVGRAITRYRGGHRAGA